MTNSYVLFSTSVYDFGFLLHCHSVMPSVSGSSLFSFESTAMPDCSCLFLLFYGYSFIFSYKRQIRVTCCIDEVDVFFE